MLCLDEKTPLQALERLHPTLPLRPSLVERQELSTILHGTVDLFAAFDVSPGDVVSAISAIPTWIRHFLRALRVRDPDTPGI